jgi:hypothetical protein
VVLALVSCGGLLIGCTPDQNASTTGEPASHSSVTASDPATTLSPSAAATPKPNIETKMTTALVSIPFKTTTLRDPSIKKGVVVVKTSGKNGSRRLTYAVTLTNGVQTSKKLVGSTVVTKPVNQVTVIGTKVAAQPAANCDPNYSGACVPIASDVDCAGGSGNGPAYVEGPVKVVGTDIYGLDADHDGIGCE